LISFWDSKNLTGYAAYHKKAVMMFVPVSEAGHVAKSRSHNTERSQTNNSSIISKRSVERLYLPEPHFLRYFVRKPQRRSPTINRGYWLRMRAVEHVVREFLERPSEQQKLVVNLGCG
jgi:tRNA wybutosine-synthesizing protein 4